MGCKGAPDGDRVQTVAEDGPNLGGSIAWMVPPIDQIRLKIARSKRHLGGLEANVSTFLRGAPYEDKQCELSARWAGRSLIFPILFIFAATLFPFRFFPDETAFRRSEPFLHWLSERCALPRLCRERSSLYSLWFRTGLPCLQEEAAKYLNSDWLATSGTVCVFHRGAASSFPADTGPFLDRRCRQLDRVGNWMPRFSIHGRSQLGGSRQT
jgi:hypothetical protein